METIKQIEKIIIRFIVPHFVIINVPKTLAVLNPFNCKSEIRNYKTHKNKIDAKLRLAPSNHKPLPLPPK